MWHWRVHLKMVKIRFMLHTVSWLEGIRVWKEQWVSTILKNFFLWKAFCNDQLGLFNCYPGYICNSGLLQYDFRGLRCRAGKIKVISLEVPGILTQCHDWCSPRLKRGLLNLRTVIWKPASAVEDEGIQVKHTAPSGDYNTAPKTTQVLAEPTVSSKEQSLNNHDMYSAL